MKKEFSAKMKLKNVQENAQLKNVKCEVNNEIAGKRFFYVLKNEI